MSPLSRSVGLIRVVAVSLLLGHLAPLGAKELTSIPLKDVALDFAMNNETGDLAAISIEKSSVTLYRAAYFEGDKTKLAGPVTVGNQPTAIVFKRYKDKAYFCISCLRDLHLWVLDAADLSVVKKVPFSRSGAPRLAASTNPEDAYLYFSRSRHFGFDGLIGAIHLGTWREEGAAAEPAERLDFGGSDVGEEIAVSASGALFYCRNPGVSPTGMQCLRRVKPAQPGERPRFESVFQAHADSYEYHPDPFDEYTASGKTLYTADLREKVAELEFMPLCFFNDRPVIVGLSGEWKDLLDPKQPPRSLMTASYNTFRVSSRTELPKSLFGPRPDLRLDNTVLYSVWHRVRMFADGKRQQIVVASKDQVVRVPLADLGLPEEPLLHLRAEGPEAFHVGQAGAIKLAKSDPRLKIEIEEAPEGVTLTDDGLRWTPAAQDVGTVHLRLRLSQDKFKRVEKLTYDVAFASVSLPFKPTSMEISQDGRWAICRHTESEEIAQQRFGAVDRNKERSETTQLALVDLQQLRVVATGKLPFEASSTCVDEHYVYVSAANVGRIEALSLKDLSRQKQAFLDDAKCQLASVGGKFLLARRVSERHEGYRHVWFSLPDLKQREVVEGTDLNFFRDRGSRLPAVANLGDAWLREGVVYDKDLKKPLLLVAPWGFLPLGGAPEPLTVLTRWGADIAADSPLVRDERFADSKAMALLEDQPAAITLETRRAEPDGAAAPNARTSLVLVVKDLVSHAAQETILLAKLDAPPSLEREWNPRGILKTAGSTAVALLGQQVYPYSLGTLPREKFPEPVRFKLAQSALVIPTDKTVKLEHTLLGGKRPYRTELVTKLPECKLDAESGTLTIDGAALVKALEASLVDAGPTGRGERQILAATSEGEDHVRAQFERLIGRPPTGIPVLIPIGLRGFDSESQRAHIQYHVSIELSRARIDEETRKREAEQEKARAKAAAEQRKAQDPSSIAELKERMDKLDQRLKRIEAQIDLLTRLLSKKAADRD